MINKCFTLASVRVLPCAKTVLMDNMTREKNVVVPSKIHTRWPNMNQDTNAPHSSAFHGLMDRMDIHLNLTFNLWRKLVAAARSSSFVGRWGMDGRYFDMDDAKVSVVGFA